MVRVGVWRNLALGALCHSCLPSCSDAVSVIERDIEPTVFVTSAATSDSTPMWLVLPMLLDVQPVLLKVDVTRHVPVQVQSFCQEHKVDITRCAGAVREALDQVVNFQWFCKKLTAENVLPGFVVTKNVLRESGENASALWVENDSEDVAMDFCDFADGKVRESDECVAALESVLRLSFDWMLHLTPCEQQGANGGEATSAESESTSSGDRLATVEQMIAELQSPLVEATEQPPEEYSSEASFHEEIGSVEETSSDAEELVVVTPDDSAVALWQTNLSVDITEAVPGLIPTTDSEHNSDIEVIDEPGIKDDANRVEANVQDKIIEIAILLEVKANSNLDARSSGFEETESSSLESEFEETDNDSRYGAVQDAEPRGTGKEVGLNKTWKVGVALVLALSIVYLAIDLMLHCVRHLATICGVPKHLVSLLLHNGFLLVRGGAQSTLTDKYSRANGAVGLNKPMSQKLTLIPEENLSKPTWGNNGCKSAAEGLTKLRAMMDSTYHPSPSFTCVAMMLMASPHAPIQHENLSLVQDALGPKNLPTPNFVQSSRDAAKTIRQKYQEELAAVQRIQKVWKASQRKVPSLDKDGLGSSDTSAPILRLLQLRSKKEAETPQGDKVAPGFHRLLLNSLPPL